MIIMYPSCLVITVLLQLFQANLAVSEKDWDKQSIGDRIANRLSDIEEGNSEEDNEPIGERIANKLDDENKSKDAKGDNSLEDRIANRLEELGISQDDISSLPVLSRFSISTLFNAGS